MPDIGPIDELPGVELEPLPEPDGTLGPYSQSALRSVVGTRMNPLSRPVWYSKHRDRLKTQASPVITAAHPQLPQWMQVLGGLDPYWRAEQDPPEEWPISRIVPRVVAGPNFPNWPIPAGSYWFDYPDITSSMNKLPERDWMLNIASRLPMGSQAILGCIGPYSVRALMWMKWRYQFWSHPFVRQWDAIVCPDFSSYLDDPRPQAAAGERMTQQFIHLGHQHGFRMIPIISFQDEDALRRQVDLLGSMYPQVNTIYLELLARSVDKNAWLWSRFELIEKHLAHLPFRFMISGVDAGKAVARLHQIFPAGNFHMVTLWPWKQTVLEPGLTEQKARYFRRKLARLEDFHRGENLPAPLKRPDDMTILLWQKEAAEAEARAQSETADDHEDRPE